MYKYTLEYLSVKWKKSYTIRMKTSQINPKIMENI